MQHDPVTTDCSVCQTLHDSREPQGVLPNGCSKDAMQALTATIPASQLELSGFVVNRLPLGLSSSGQHAAQANS